MSDAGLAPAVEVHELVRIYSADKAGDVKALDGITLSVADGEVVSLLGPNGAGKTTLMRILATVLLPTGGRAAVMGHDVVQDPDWARGHIGLSLGGERGHYELLTARENLEYFAALYHVKPRVARERAVSLLGRFNLSKAADRRVQTFSRGMKQRLHLARALITDAKVLLLDEPSTGMDPVGAVELRDVLRDLRAEGRTILLATHNLDEAQEVSDRIALINHGRLLDIETPRALRARIQMRPALLVRRSEHELPDLSAIAAIEVEPSADGVRIFTESRDARLKVMAELIRHRIGEFAALEPSLSDVYMSQIADRRASKS